MLDCADDADFWCVGGWAGGGVGWRAGGCFGGGPVVAKSGRVVADSDLARTIEGLVSAPGVARAHWGIDVVGLDGTPIYSMNEGQFFQPASNAKLFTTTAAMALLGPRRRLRRRWWRRVF